jgi:putative ABC transport system permease protein
MRVLEAWRLALESMASHKLRSFLTLLGISIAVHSLIAVNSVTEGLSLYVSERLANLRPGVFILTKFGIVTSLREWIRVQRRRNIRLEDYMALRAHLTTARAVGAGGFMPGQVRSGNKSVDDIAIRGATPNLLHIATARVAVGRYVSEQDDQHRAAVCFVGHDVAVGLFGTAFAVGRTVWVRGQPFEVIGVAHPLGGILGQSQDRFVYLPLTTFLKLYGPHRASVGIWVLADGIGQLELAQEEARGLLRALRRLRPDQEDDFGVVSSGSVLALWVRLTGTIAAVAAGVAVVFLVVGGIMVMNIMLVSVTERTREIGLRKSVGARRLDVLLQFLIEAVALSIAGGAVGVLMAWGATSGLARLVDVPLPLSAGAVAGSVAASAAVGLACGLYPARQAADLDPIAALRQE